MAAAAHVVAVDAGAHFVPAPGQHLFFDDGAGCLHVVEGRLVTSCPLPRSHAASALPGAPLEASHMDGTLSDAGSDGSVDGGRPFLVSAGPPVLLLRTAPGGAVTALQRSAHVVEFVDHATGNLFLESPADPKGRHGSRLLGFFWTSPSGFVMVTTQGMELYSLQSSRQRLRREGAQAVAGVRWYSYCHSARLALLGFGANAAKAQPFAFPESGAGGTAGGAAGGVLRLSLLDLAPPWVSSPVKVQLLGGPAPGPAQDHGPSSTPLPGAASPASPRQPQLAGAESVWVVALYGRLYCAYHDRRAGLLRLYRLLRDACGLAYEVPLPGAAVVQLSVVDSVLLVHSMHTTPGSAQPPAVVALYDVDALPASGGLPLCEPLAPALPREASASAGPGSPTSGAQPGAQPPTPLPLSAPPGGAPQATPPGPGPSGPAAVPSGAPATPDLQRRHEAGPPSPVHLFPPDWAVDADSGAICRLCLDLQAVAEAMPRLADALAFLQRRSPSRAPRCDPGRIALLLLRGAMERQLALPALRAAFDQATRRLAAAQHRPASASGGRTAAAVHGAACAAASPDAIVHGVLAPLRAERAVPPAYLHAVLCELLGSCAASGVAWPDEVALLSIDLLMDRGAGHLVGPQLRALPALRCLPAAERLEQLWRQGDLGEGLDLALRIYEQLGAHRQLALGLLQQGRLAEAARLARAHTLAGPDLAAALEEARATGPAAGRDPLLARAERWLGGGPAGEAGMEAAMQRASLSAAAEAGAQPATRAA